MSELGQKLVEKVVREKLGRQDFSITSAVGGDANHTFLVDEEFVVKVEKDLEWTSDWQEEMFREPLILEMLEHQEEVMVPKMIDSGRIEGQYYRVLEYLEGYSLDKYSEGKDYNKLGNEEKKSFVRRMGKTLARIHELKSFGRFGAIKPENESFSLSDKNWSEAVLTLQEWWFKKLRSKGYSETVDKIEKVLKQYSEELDRVDESRLLHMEFDLRNLLIQDDDIVVLDWETSAAGDPMLDLVMTEKRLIWRGQEDQEVKEAFREGYSEVRDIELSDQLEQLYELFQLTRFLLIHQDQEEIKNRVENRLQELLDSLN